MPAFYASPDLTAFVDAQALDHWYVGVVNVLQGHSSARVRHECLPLRDTPAEALRDARKDAKALIQAWREKVRL